MTETMIRRKPVGSGVLGGYSSGSINNSNSSYNNSGVARAQRPLGQQDSSSADDKEHPRSANKSEMSFSHGPILSLAMLPALLIMLAFGGRPSLLVLCFGAVVTYIFDLLGAMEVM